MNQHDIDEFIRIAEVIKDEGLFIPNLPLPLWYAVHSFLTLPAVEVIMTQTGKDFLLQYRKDEHFDGWEIPGGYIGYKEDLKDACQRIALRETGLSPVLKKVISAEVQKNHPYSGGISIVCVCEVSGTPLNGEFLTKIPEKMVPYHGKFIQEFLGFADNQK